MMNSIKNLFAMNTKVKTEEQATKEIDKLQTQENDLQSQLDQATTEHSKVSAALDIISASLIIDENDKQALTTKKKAEVKLEALAKQIETTQVKLSEVAEKKQAAVQELYRSRGEVARKHNQKVRRDMVIASRFNRAFGIEDVFQLNTQHDQSIDLGVEYGLGAIDSLDSNSEDWKFIVQLSNEDTAEGDRQADVIARDLEEAIKGVFEKHNVELQEQTLVNLSRI
ncbi:MULTISPECIES: hypothetical protein [Bacillus]|uniref:Uncharacterized protein n=1 Tax=Bacillus cereus TaxID=1396 RepID=A0A2B9E6V5_BACCE|nr:MULTISPECIES: hypothetical protein [Bacillus cereus group]PEK97410.1 hypothetical protein CN600_01285 [Bacillus mycoides]PGM95486.1 hypothetical protein CN958_06660 [Bacillus cereus]QWG85739.1 hypothetical protein EXW61_20505 [Bacillus mycoides]HDR7632990.1 hypothetical protein [Bacillus mycoides]